jgi:hypothetical protein
VISAVPVHASATESEKPVVALRVAVTVALALLVRVAVEALNDPLKSAI